MPDLLRYHGLELPVYPPDTPIAATEEELMAEAQAAETDTIVRLAYIRAIGCRSLKEVLGVIEDGMEMVADLCGARVVNHRFGLLENPLLSLFGEHREPPATDHILPEGHVLVAEVDVIRGIEPLSDEQELAVENAETVYRQHTRRTKARYRWSDSAPRQFTNGVAPLETETDFWLLDVDPLLLQITRF